MKAIPLYKRTWFLRGVVTVVVGLFVMLLSMAQVKSYEERYPELGQSGADRILDQMKQAPSEEEKTRKTPEEDKAEMERWRVAMLHGKYKRYIYIGAFLIVAGLGMMALGYKEPTVPELPDEEDDEDTSTTAQNETTSTDTETRERG